jgi:hypothetical protein
MAYEYADSARSRVDVASACRLYMFLEVIIRLAYRQLRHSTSDG